MRLAIIHQADRESWSGISQEEIDALKEEIRREFRDPDMAVIALPPGVNLDILAVDDFDAGDDDDDDGDVPSPRQPAPAGGASRA